MDSSHPMNATGLKEGTVSVQALSAGHFTLPEFQFVSPVEKTARKTVPSLAFLIQHVDVDSGDLERVVFDLGLRKDTDRYSAPIRKHILTRQPMSTQPDVVESLARGGLGTDDIDYIIFSHVHWDHIGEPQDFASSMFIVGHGGLALLDGTVSSLRGGHSFFEHNLLPLDRSIELSDPLSSDFGPEHKRPPSLDRKNLVCSIPWKSYKHLPHTLDLFGDGSLLIVDAPGHLAGHINILARTDTNTFVYLSGDSFHDRRLLSGEKEFSTWQDEQGHVCCIHTDRQLAAETIQRIRRLKSEGVEVIAAHDIDWEVANRGRFFGAC